jgi:hypothetical protein
LAGEETLAQEVSALVIKRAASAAQTRDLVFELLDVAGDRELGAVARERQIMAELERIGFGEGGDGG